MLKGNMRLGFHLSKASLLLLTFIFLTASLFSACGDSLDSGDEGDSEELLPVIFLPGIQGSVLNAAKDSAFLWPPGGLEADVGFTTIPIVRENFFRLSLNPETAPHEAIYASDVIRQWGSDDFYILFLNFLKDPQQGGYVEYDIGGNPARRTTRGIFLRQKPKPSLFVFAYDWRLPIEESAHLLSEYVEVVNKFYPGEKVNIVTHSMGGLVARRYIIDHPDSVNKLITIAAPFLGSAKPLYQMIYGKLGAPVSYGYEATMTSIKDVLTGGTTNPFAEGPIREMLNYFPGVHELMLSEGYYALGGQRYTFIPATTEELLKVFSSEEMMGPNGKVDELFPNPARVGTILKTPAKTNRDFHAYSANGKNQDDWSQDTTRVKYYHIIGVQGSNDTPWQLVETPGPQSRLRTYNLEPLGGGDGTVPLLSAARIGAGKNFNASNAKLFIYTKYQYGTLLASGRYLEPARPLLDDYEDMKNPAVTIYTGSSDTELEHTGIMTNHKVWAKVLELLHEKDEPAVTTPPPATQPAPPNAATERRWALVEPKLPPAQQQPATSNDQFGDNSVTIVANESEISTQIVTSKQGREVGKYIMTLRFDKPPQELSSLNKGEWRVTWEMKVSGVPRYTADYIELGQGDFGTSKLIKISMAENPTGSTTLMLSPPNLASYITEGSFELSAKLFTAGDRYKVRWVYHTK